MNGAETIHRGIELCGDTPNIPVYQHAIKYMGDIDGIVAVQANSPTIHEDTIREVVNLMEHGAQEVMTVDKDGKIYGSVWALTRYKLMNYGDPYHPEPEKTVVDLSVDIHTEEDLAQAKQDYENNRHHI